jgi:hypothetical protein
MGWETNRREALSATMSGSLAKSKANLLPPRARFSFWWQAWGVPHALKNLQKIVARPPSRYQRFLHDRLNGSMHVASACV